MSKFPRLAAVFAVAIAPLLAWQAGAWACVPIPLVTVLPRASAPAGTTVMVQGENFPGPVEIRWNSLEGPLLATAQDANVPTAVQVPSGPTGLSMVIVLTRQSDRTVGVVGRAPFLVEGRSGSAGAGQASTGTGSRGSASHVWVIVLAAVVVVGVWGAFLLRRRPMGGRSLANPIGESAPAPAGSEPTTPARSGRTRSGPVRK